MEAWRARILELAEQRQTLIESLRQNPRGLSWCDEHTSIVDTVVRTLVDDVRAANTDLPPLSVIATGGYGRRELCPFSDVDLCVVPRDENSTQMDDAIRTLFARLHWAFRDAMHMEIGYAYMLVSDAPGLDAKTRTGLLDARLVVGSNELFDRVEDALVESFPVGAFLLSKIREREAMMAKFHDSALVVEPHLKEGAGGIRCFQCANWIRLAIGEQALRKSSAYSLITRMRNLLHLIAGRKQDLLNRSRRDELAELLNRDPYEIASEIAAAGSELHAAYRNALQEIRETRFPLSEGVFAVRGESRITGGAEAGEVSVGIALATQLGLTVEPIKAGAGALRSGPSAAYAVSRGEAVLRNLDRCGLLERLLPELTACRTLMPRDSSHTFTVFEHTLQVVRRLESAGNYPFLADVKSSLNDEQPLYVAALLHDVGKRDLSAPHSETGARMAREVCQRWVLRADFAENVVWLVENHLEMARVIRMRDVQNPVTISEFAQLVGRADRLAMLTLLTWADVNAVGPEVWTLAQEAFLRDLYERTEAYLQQASSEAHDPATYRQRLLRRLKTAEVSEEELHDFIQSLPAHYVMTTAPELVKLHMGFAQKAKEGETTVEIYHQPDIGTTDLTVCTMDSPGLLSKVLGVFYAYDLTVVGIRASTSSSQPAFALDVFTVSFGNRSVPQATCAHVAQALRAVIDGTRSVQDVLRERGKEPERPQQFYTLTFVAGSPAVIEVRAPKGRGMPYRFSRVIAEQGWNILAARVSQWAGNATAAFYVQGGKGESITQSEIDRVFGRPVEELR